MLCKRLDGATGSLQISNCWWLCFGACYNPRFCSHLRDQVAETFLPVAAMSFSDEGHPSQEAWWSGLHKEWDQCPIVRARLRSGLRLLLPHPLCMSGVTGQENHMERSIHNVRQNKVVLLPAMRRWGQGDPEAVPQVDFLFNEIEELFRNGNPDKASAGEIHKDCWALRKLMTLVKAQLSKVNPPRAPCLNDAVYILSTPQTKLRALATEDADMLELYDAFGFTLFAEEYPQIQTLQLRTSAHFFYHAHSHSAGAGC